MSDRQKELDGYVEQYGRYIVEEDGVTYLRVGVQSFQLGIDSDLDLSKAEKRRHREWFKRMICNALHKLVEEQISEREKV